MEEKQIDLSNVSTNHFKVRTHLPFVQKFCYVDTENYLADELFRSAGASVHKTEVLAGPPGVTQYRVVFGVCPKWHYDKVKWALLQLPRKAELCGGEGYTAFCERFATEIIEALSGEGALHK